MKVFLAAPFTQTIDQKTGLVDPSYRDWLEAIIRLLRIQGHEVICAHEREKWGQDLDAPGAAMRADFDAIKDSDLVLAHIGNPVSPGVQMELGIALSFGKRLIVLAEVESNAPYLIGGLCELADCRILRFDDPLKLLDTLHELIPKASR
jgi:hypothetical protein